MTKAAAQPASLVKISKDVSTKLSMAKLIIKIVLCFNDVKLSDTETTVLSYFMVYGVNTDTKSLIIKSQVCKNIANVKTIMVKLKKLELIYKDDLNGKVYVAEVFKLKLNPVMGIYLRINSNPE